MIKNHKTKGFTLIELLVVISIIGMLSSIVLASLNSARAKARDAKRLADFKNFSTAMEFYFDKYGKYPQSPNTPPGTGGVGGSHNRDFETVAGLLVADGFLSSIPKDPSGAYMIYDYGGGNDIGEIIVTSLENISPTTIGPFNSCRPFDQNWCSYTLASTAYCLCHKY